MATDSYTGWAILELVGRRLLAGYVSPAMLAGTPCLRVVVCGPKPDSFIATQFYSGSAIFSLTACKEAAARRVMDVELVRMPGVLKRAIGFQAGEVVSIPEDGS